MRICHAFEKIYSWQRIDEERDFFGFLLEYIYLSGPLQ